jgi:hypothetical protein
MLECRVYNRLLLVLTLLEPPSALFHPFVVFNVVVDMLRKLLSSLPGVRELGRVPVAAQGSSDAGKPEREAPPEGKQLANI